MRPHKRLKVWQEAMELVKDIYEMTAKMPEEEKYGLVSQIRRAAVSVPSNIAEGAARTSKKESMQFYAIARGSLSEIDTQIELGYQLKMINKELYTKINRKIEKVDSFLNGLMKFVKQSLIILVTLSLSHLVTFSFAADAGTESMEFLRMPAGVRETGMGGSGVCEEDIMNIFKNPASCVNKENKEIGFAYGSLYEGMGTQHLGVIVPVKSSLKNYGTVTFGIGNLNMGSVQGYDINGVAGKKYEPASRIINLGYGRSFFDRKLRAGMGIKLLSEDLGEAQGTGNAIDLGIIYKIKAGAWSGGAPVYMGVSIQNLGGGIKYEGSKENIPQFTRIGFSWGKKLGDNYLSTAVDFCSASSGAGGISTGLEFKIKDMFMVRMGYRKSDEMEMGQGLMYGFGFEILNTRFDYAYANFGELGGTHRMGINIKFGKIVSLKGITGERGPSPEEAFRKGMKYYNEGKYPEAILEFNKVLDAEPFNEKAFEMMKKAHKKMQK